MIEEKESLVGQVNVGIIRPVLQEKTATPSENTQEVVNDLEYDGLSKVIVNPIPSEYIIPTGNLVINSNGDYDVKNYETVEVETSGVDINEYFPAKAIVTQNVVARLIKKIPLIDTSSVINMGNMFRGCSFLTEIPLIDTSNVTIMSSMFEECEQLTTIPQLDTSNVTTMSSMFNGCSRLVSIPQLNTSKVTTMSLMFGGCRNLTTIPVLDASSIIYEYGFNNMFSGTEKLNTQSLDNVLQMCINASSYAGTKTLYSLGFRSTKYSSATIQALPSYQDFINAGWSIGY